ncbi:MAG: sel1 repeat family protein [Duodenibacillus sp.]|nr:sel1 repeat family protein [Duodenibacillus sp.]
MSRKLIAAALAALLLPGLACADENFDKVKARALAGDAAAFCELADLYYAGKGVDRSVDEAARWYQRAAEQNIPQGQLALGILHFSGQGVKQDPAAAAALFEKAAAQDYAPAQYNLAYVYMSGAAGFAQDQARGLELLGKSADNGFAPAQYQMGVMHHLGKGGLAKDEAKGFAYFKKSADQGYAPAQFNVGVALANGLPEASVMKNPKAAMDYMQKACAGGVKPACDSMARLQIMSGEAPAGHPAP